MKLENLTITATATRNYQKGEVALTVSDFDKEDLLKVEALVVSESIKVLNSVCERVNVEPKEEPKVEVQYTQPKPQYTQPKSQYKAPYINREGNPISAKQKSFLQKLGYTGDTSNMSSSDAYKLIESLKGANHGN